MRSRILTIVLAIAVVMTLVVFLGSYASNFRLPGNDAGYEPVQPIAYSHRLHAGELQIPCLNCHAAAELGRRASIPAAGLCMNCHRFVTAPYLEVKAEEAAAAKENRKPRPVVSPELKKIYDALALGDDLTPRPSGQGKPVEWQKVHNLPDFVYFNHSVHVKAGVDCQTCHGAVETMERVRQVADLTMGWCVNCHRDVNANGVKGKAVHASTDCSACHY